MWSNVYNYRGSNSCVWVIFDVDLRIDVGLSSENVKQRPQRASLAKINDMTLKEWTKYLFQRFQSHDQVLIRNPRQNTSCIHIP